MDMMWVMIIIFSLCGMVGAYNAWLHVIIPAMARAALRYTDTHEPNFKLTYVSEPDTVYLLRWHLIPRNRFFNVYLHRMLNSDEGKKAA